MKYEEKQIIFYQVRLALENMSDEERKDFLYSIADDYCRYCGRKEYGDNCQCENDE